MSLTNETNYALYDKYLSLIMYWHVQDIKFGSTFRGDYRFLNDNFVHIPVACRANTRVYILITQI